MSHDPQSEATLAVAVVVGVGVPESELRMAGDSLVKDLAECLEFLMTAKTKEFTRCRRCALSMRREDSRLQPKGSRR